MEICIFALDNGEKYVIITSVGFGSVPEWPKGADCKSVVFDFGGSNPPAPTRKKDLVERQGLFSMKRSLREHEAAFGYEDAYANEVCLRHDKERFAS